MPLKFMYITNQPDVAVIAEKNSVDRIWVDLETQGKEERQKGINSVKSYHKMTDVSAIRNVISKSKLLVRINPLYIGSKAEVDEVIARGADIIMLPMIRSADDAKRFVDLVMGRAKVLLLVETIEAEQNIEAITAVSGIDEIHIGLNDLHLAYHKKFMFELLAEGKIDEICGKIKKAGLPYGFGGIARLDEGMLPARHIIAEHYRVGSSMAILSRSFYDSMIENDIKKIERVFEYGMREIREYEDRLTHEISDSFVKNHETVIREVNEIITNKV